MAPTQEKIKSAKSLLPRHIFKNVLFLIPLLFPFMVNGQGNIQRETMMFITAGDNYYQEEQYARAASFYERALALDSAHVYAHYHLAECLRKTFAYGRAIPHYQQVINHGLEKYPVALFYYPLMQKLEGKFASADANFTAFLRYAENHPFENSRKLIEKARIERDGCRYAMARLTREFSDYGFRHPDPPLNSEYNDYAPWIFGNDSTLVFTSGRPSATGKVENNRYGEYFSDNFRYSKDSTGWRPVRDGDNFDVTNSPFIEGTGSFNRDKTKFYFTGCYARTGCKIYVSVKKNGKWTAPEMLNQNINPEGADAMQPSLSPGADTLFFVSNRPGGLGENDIWMSISDSVAESWGPPVNLGRKINTPFNETAPFFYPGKDLLFFASDGHKGFGGLDIFVATGTTFQQAIVHNMGFPFNSSSNDSYMVLGETIGYLASNRTGSLGGFDIYRYDMAAARRLIYEITHEGSAGRILHSRVRNLSASDMLVMRDEDKFFYKNLPPEDKARVDRIVAATLASLKGYGEKPLSASDGAYFRGLSRDQQAGIDRMARLLYQGRRHSVEQLIPREEPQRNNVPAVSATPFMAFNDLWDIPVPDQIQSPPGEGHSTAVISDGGRNANGEEPSPTFAADRDKNASEQAEKVLAPRFENIYFDLDKVVLRPEARKVLDEIAAYYQKDPGIRITISVYTDNTGTNPYNVLLSKERGELVLAYLVKKGLPQNILQVQARGNKNPVASNDTPAGRQINRRITFDIKGATMPYHPEVTTYITQRILSLDELAAITRNTVTELQQYNGLTTSAVIPANTPVRIRDVERTEIGADFLLQPPSP